MVKLGNYLMESIVLENEYGHLEIKLNELLKKKGLNKNKLSHKAEMNWKQIDKELLINNYLQNIPSCAILSSNISNCIGGKNGYTC